MHVTIPFALLEVVIIYSRSDHGFPIFTENEESQILSSIMHAQTKLGDIARINISIITAKLHANKLTNCTGIGN